ncbi:MAG: radical SAM protein [Synergistaceae bacterium]
MSSQNNKRVTAWESWEKYRDDENWTIKLPKGGDLPWALFYPADYSIGASNLGIHYILRGLRERGVAVERFFETPIPFRSVESDTLLERFPIITAGISYEDGVVSFFKWLHKANIPLNGEKRWEHGYPLIGVGGAMSYINPLIFTGVCDFILLGDALDTLDFLVENIRKYMGDGDRKKLLTRLSERDDILVPSVHIEKGYVINKRKPLTSMKMDAEHPMFSTWTTPRSAFGNSLLLELQRGCARNCKYCTLPGCFGRMRFRSFETIKEHIDELLNVTQADQVGLVTPEASDYPDLSALIEYLEERNVGISFASLRIDRLTEKMISVLVKGGRHSITLAPETGNDALRFSCGKKFTNQTVIEKLILAQSLGIDKVKLYFMIGLPNEEDEDIHSISSLCALIIDVTGVNLVLSISPFVPKPGTPWGKEEFAGVSQIRNKYKLITSDIKKIKKKTPQLRLTSPKEAEREYNLAWFGYNESKKMAENIEKNFSINKIVSDREAVFKEFEFLW